jgi:hypothetical protein
MTLNISLPSSTSSSPPTSPGITNTIIVANLPRELFHSLALEALRNHFSSYGVINQWAPIGAFGRIIIVYEDDDAAETAKLESDPVVVEPASDRYVHSLCLPSVFFGIFYPLHMTE